MTELTLVPLDPKPIAIVAVIDRSGSMGSIRSDAIGSFNTFLTEQQKEEGEATVTIALFDNEYELLQDGVDIHNSIFLSDNNFIPRGMTALYDAIGRTVNTVKAQRVAGKIDGAIFVILTDGQENSSHEYKADQIKELISSCEKDYGWSFVFLAANQDAFATGSSFGIQAGNAFNYDASAAGLLDATVSMNASTTSYRKTFVPKQ